MKTMKSALLGVKNLDDSSWEVLILELKEVVRMHRAIIIQRLLSDLPTYLDYKFQVSKPSKTLMEQVKDELLALKNSGVELAYYESVVNQLQTRSVVHLTNEPFYVEIDATMSHLLKLESRNIINIKTASV